MERFGPLFGWIIERFGDYFWSSGYLRTLKYINHCDNNHKGTLPGEGSSIRINVDSGGQRSSYKEGFIWVWLCQTFGRHVLSHVTLPLPLLYKYFRRRTL